MERNGRDVGVLRRGVRGQLEVGNFGHGVARRARDGDEAEAGGEKDDSARMGGAEEAEEVRGYEFGAADIDFLFQKAKLAQLRIF